MESNYEISKTYLWLGPALMRHTGAVQHRPACEIPVEMVKMIFSFLDEISIVSLASVSHCWYKAAVESRKCTFLKLANLIKIWSENSTTNCWEKSSEIIRQEKELAHNNLTSINISELKIKEVFLNELRMLKNDELKLLSKLACACSKPKKFEHLFFTLKLEKERNRALSSVVKGGEIFHQGSIIGGVISPPRDKIYDVIRLKAKCGNLDDAYGILRAAYKMHSEPESYNESMLYIYNQAKLIAQLLILQNVEVDRGIELLEKWPNIDYCPERPYLAICKSLVKSGLVYKALRVANCVDHKSQKRVSDEKILCLEFVSKALTAKGDIDKAIEILIPINFEYYVNRALWSVFKYAIALPQSDSRGHALLKLAQALNIVGKGSNIQEEYHYYDDDDLKQLAKRLFNRIDQMSQNLRKISRNKAKADLKYASPTEVVKKMCVEDITAVLSRHSHNQNALK